ncbi:MAG: helix-hairpin-helix domain-containing protein [Deltaproteobacteria bacterium]|nr:helix-hairpin-helix domain-containing protein [Deltaproteobacteria bacterium]
MKRFSPIQEKGLILLLALVLIPVLARAGLEAGWGKPQPKALRVGLRFSGQVDLPGLHLFDRPPNLGQALQAAGGRLDGSQSLDVETLINGLWLKVVKGRLQVQPLPQGQRFLLGLPLDINAATAEELTLLPNLGPKRAGRIVAVRFKKGQFNHVNELLEVPGLGPTILARLKPLITCRPAGQPSAESGP